MHRLIARRTHIPGMTPVFGDRHFGLCVNTADNRAWVLVDGRYVEIAAIDPEDQAALVDQCANEGLLISTLPTSVPEPRGLFRRLFG